MDWVWGNAFVIEDVLDELNITQPSIIDDLLDGLDEILADPAGGACIRMQGTAAHTDRWIGALPHGWVIVFTPYPMGIPPATKTPTLVARHMYNIATLSVEWPET